ncbi:MAG: DUF4373 domain-containing protein [Tissierellia bacterium]|nr:DUF4373 domain-containing protein [Tissierellia bacterium]
MDYFPHDCDASTDDKIEAMRSLHGNDGYAFYFILLERVFRMENAEINMGIPAIKLALIKRVGVTPEKLEVILATALEIGAFDQTIFNERGVITSNGIKRRSRMVEDLRTSWRDKKTKGIIPRENREENPEKTP